MTSYAAVIERADDGGYGAWCPELPWPRRWPVANS